MSQIQFPTTKKTDIPSEFPKRESWLLFSAPKAGKTTCAAQWPECLILELEPGGAKYTQGAYVLPVSSMDQLREIYAELHAMKELPYQTIAIDPIDVVNDWAEEEARQELEIAEMGQAPFGADWGRTRAIVLNVIKQFSNLPVNLLILAHSRWAIVNEVAIGHTIDLPGKLARFALAAVDNVLFIATNKKGQRKLVFQPTEGVEAGSRNPVLASAGECACSFAALRELFEKEESE